MHDNRSEEDRTLDHSNDDNVDLAFVAVTAVEDLHQLNCNHLARNNCCDDDTKTDIDRGGDVDANFRSRWFDLTMKYVKFLESFYCAMLF